MTSQLNVDTIVDKAGSGGSNVKMANTSTYVSDGGAVTQNTVQGLCKAWVADWNMSAASLGDSLNISSVTDEATGTANPNFTNPFSSTDYTHHCSDDNYGMNNAAIGSQTTTSVRSLSYHSNFALADARTNTSEVGDLA